MMSQFPILCLVNDLWHHIGPFLNDSVQMFYYPIKFWFLEALSSLHFP